jgi:hypothetical protein
MKTQAKKTLVGFDKITMIQGLLEDNVILEIQEFKDYSEKIGNLKIEESGDVFKAELIGDLKGITWTIQPCTDTFDLGFTHNCEAIIDPKLLLGIKDPAVMCNESHIEKIVGIFDKVVKEISVKKPGLSNFIPYKISYGINFSLKDMGYKCSSDQMMTLLKMAEPPIEYKKHYYKHRRTPDLSLSYHDLGLGDESDDDTIVRCYEKPDDIICFEAECGYHKLKAMMLGIIHNTPFAKINSFQMLKKLLSKETCRFIVADYYASSMTFGNFYKLKDAIQKVKDIGYNQLEEDMLIYALGIINKSGGIKNVTTKSLLDDILHHHVLRDLMNHNINPITIPDDWPFDSIPALLGGYMDDDKNDG